jgi:tetratricopeptide (TPR) repeat protein
LGHRLAAEWLMAQGENDAFILAEHLHRGGEDARAAPWYRRAAEQALEGNDFTSALAHTGRALSCGLPPPAAGEALLIQASAAFWSGDLETHERAAQSAMRYFPTRSSRWYAAALEAARTASRLGRHEALTPLVERVLGDNRRGTVKERTMLMARIAVPVLRAGDTVLAGRIFERLAQDEAQAVTNPIARAWLERLHGFRGLVNGDRAVYLEHTSRAVEYFERAGDQRNALTFLTSVGFANIALGRHDQAAQVLKRALAGAQRLGLETARLVALHNLSIALAMAGDAESGIRLQREVLEAAQRGGDRWIQCVAMTSLADLLLRSDNAEEALHHARRASELSDRPHRAVALSLMARAELALGRPGDALTAAEAAHNLLDELGGIEDGEAGVRLALIDALLATGHKERAVELLRRAKDRIMEQAARLPTAELRRTFLREVPDHADTLTRAGNQGV